MKCLKCGKECNDDMNFCPYCGSNFKGETQEVTQVVMVKNNHEELYTALSQLAMYFGAGMALVSVFLAFKGFGLFASRQINLATVWITFGVSVAISVAGALLYFLKFNKQKKK